MPEPTMNPDQADIGVPLVGRLISEQFPHWAGLPIVEVGSAGTDNAIHRLGEDMAVRLPRRWEAVAEVARQYRWLPRLAPLLPLAVPVPLSQGLPRDEFPFPWLVCRWLEGHSAVAEPAIDLPDAAVRLGRFVATLQRIDATGGPPSFRGGPVSVLDDRVREEIRALGADGTVDPELVTRRGGQPLPLRRGSARRSGSMPTFTPVNLLARHGRLAAVIDFGGLGAGDPAIDMLPAWAWLTAGARELFRAEVAGAGDPGR